MRFFRRNKKTKEQKSKSLVNIDKIDISSSSSSKKDGHKNDNQDANASSSHSKEDAPKLPLVTDVPLRLQKAHQQKQQEQRQPPGQQQQQQQQSYQAQQRQEQQPDPEEPTMDMVPSLLHDLQTARSTSHAKPARALRYLFALSEQDSSDAATITTEQHSHVHTRRLELVQRIPKLVPTVLLFLKRCPSKSSQQYLTLLVLNNLSIPAENKRTIAVTFGGARLFAHLLCQDPSCHLMAIILVNLTFTDAELRHELVHDSQQIELLPALSYCVGVASLSPDELVQRPLLQQSVTNRRIRSTTTNHHASPMPPVRLTYNAPSTTFGDTNPSPTTEAQEPTPQSPREYLDLYHQSEMAQRQQRQHQHQQPLSSSKCNFPDTIRWCLVALKHTTRPVNSGSTNVDTDGAVACQQLVDCGIVPLLLKWITIASNRTGVADERPVEQSYLQNHIANLNYGEDDIRLAPTPTKKQSIFRHTTPESHNNTSMASSHSPIPIDPLLDDTTNASIAITQSSYIQNNPNESTNMMRLHGSNPFGNNDESMATDASEYEDDLIHYSNTPATWDTNNSIQDSALFVLMNLSLCASTRHVVSHHNAITILSHITQYTAKVNKSIGNLSELQQDDSQLLLQVSNCEFQAMKAKMTLAYLIGSEGNFGQLKLGDHPAGMLTPLSQSARQRVTTDQSSLLEMTDRDVELLIELLSNTLHNRPKDGAGGYSASTFNVKYALFAIRCLLTLTSNQIKMTKRSNDGYPNVTMSQLNSLLVKVLAYHSVPRTANAAKRVSSGLSASSSSSSSQSYSSNVLIDAEAAEYAAFSLYLLSSYGFEGNFLPSMFSSSSNQTSLTAKVLIAYLHTPNLTVPGQHAAEQLLLRLKYLSFNGSIRDVANQKGSVPGVSDLTFEGSLLSDISRIHVEKRRQGAIPHLNVSNRSIVRIRVPHHRGRDADPSRRSPGTVFPSALHAAQLFSFGSTKIQHHDLIDDVLIANRLASCASKEEKKELYGYYWRWQDEDPVKAVMDGEPNSLNSANAATNPAKASFFSNMTSRLGVDGDGFTMTGNENNEPFSFFGLRCGCGTDGVE